VFSTEVGRRALHN